MDITYEGELKLNKVYDDFNEERITYFTMKQERKHIFEKYKRLRTILRGHLITIENNRLSVESEGFELVENGDLNNVVFLLGCGDDFEQIQEDVLSLVDEYKKGEEQ